MRIANIVLLVVAMSSLIAESQLVSVGPPDPHYCDKLKVEPNLTIELDTHILGLLVDASGEPFRNSPVELRAFLSPTKQVLATTTMTDANGRFHIENVKAGKYRLLAPQARGFLQPGPQRCASAQCELSITLHPSSTDTPESVCPAR
jgi:5-hydroxyisourate hydrolase-like protein (transthyretin family)